MVMIVCMRVCVCVLAKTDVWSLLEMTVWRVGRFKTGEERAKLGSRNRR